MRCLTLLFSQSTSPTCEDMLSRSRAPMHLCCARACVCGLSATYTSVAQAFLTSDGSNPCLWCLSQQLRKKSMTCMQPH